MAESKGLTNQDLNHYFENEVKLSRQETSNAKEVVLTKVNQLLEFINKEDARFGSRPMRVGSSFQGLKTKAPDEFDFNIILVELGEFKTTPLTKRYYGFSEDVDKDALKTTPVDIDIISKSVPLPDPPTGYTFINYGKNHGVPMWQNASDLIFKENIIPYLVRKQLKGLLQKAIRDLDLRGELRLGRKVHGPALTLRIPYNQDGIEEISVDFAPTIPSIGKMSDFTKWPPANAKWPCRDKVNEIMSIPLNAIAKEPFDWLLSYAACEEVLMADIDKDGGCRKKSHRLMKRLKEDFWCKTSKPVISSYCLKNILLLECEKYPQSQDWEQEMLNIRVSSMIKYLLHSIQRRQLPHYFNRRVNLIKAQVPNEVETLELERKNIEAFADDPSRFFSEE